MTSLRQIEANRHNALKSTGPKTKEGKGRSRRNALRHGFTAETVIEPSENPEEYRAFEAAIVSEYLPQTPVARYCSELLASGKSGQRTHRSAEPIRGGPGANSCRRSLLCRRSSVGRSF